MRIFLEKIHNWLIARVIGNKPVVANIELNVSPGTYEFKDTIFLKNASLKY
jgi:hypothetical protein